MTPGAYLSVEQVAAEIGVDEEYVRRQCKAGVIRAKKLGNKWRIHPDDLAAFMRPGGDADRAAPAAQKRDKKLSARQQRKAS